MSKIKKVAIGILSGIMIIFGMQSMSNAYFVGQNLTITYSQYASSSNIFCVEHGQALTEDNSYKIVSNVKIEGTKSTDHDGKTIDNWHNAKFAYILSADNGAYHDSGPVQNEIWNYGYTWMNNVGKNHNGLSLGFISSVPGNSYTATTNLDKEATNYANNIENGKKVTDNTKKDDIKVEAYDKDGKQYMRIGPFNWSFAGKLTEVSIYDQDSKTISGKLYSTFNGKTENWINVGDIKSNNDFYISIPADSGVSKITKVTGKMTVDVKAVNIWFLESTTGYKQNLIIREPYGATETVDLSFDYDIAILGNLKVIKINKDNTKITLPGVGFYIQNKSTGKYVKQATDGVISYVDKKEDATEFITDSKGEISIKNLIVGIYRAYETQNPNYGYKIIKEGQEKSVEVDKTAELKIPNDQVFVKLSGYVWVDKISGKQSYRNDLFKDNDYDSDDLLLDGIKVRLKNKTTGEVVKETTTANGGKYLFIDVLIEELENYYIEFEFDGLTYTNVVPHIDKDNGSKAAENATVRDNFNKNFSVVEGKSENTSITRDSKGNEKYTLSYNLDEKGHTAILINVNPESTITSNTDEANYVIKDKFAYGQEEIKNINLGLYEREQPDIKVMKDLHNVNVAINGYNHIYEYGQRINNAGVYEQGFNVGVKFSRDKQDEYGNMLYSAAVYKADYEYVNEQDRSKELKVYVTYQIRMQNSSDNLEVQVNNLVDYYDSRYTLIKVGTGLDEQRNVTGDISYTDTSYTDASYKKAIIDTNTKIKSQGYVDIYIQFMIDRETVSSIIDDVNNVNNTVKDLNNVVEINSYSVFDKEGKVYAGVDENSNPGNAVPGKVTTYQDDTDSAPGLRLEVANAREMVGKVFLDSTSNELMTGEVRLGSGEYEEGEKGIEGVKVTLTETTGSQKVYEATTDANGDFLISGFIPGDYTVTYTWGDETYTVQNYKGTVYDSTRDQNDKNWYKSNVDKRQTDAIDNYNVEQEAPKGSRLQIDEEIKTGNITRTKMDSTTPIMGIGVEYETSYPASIGDKYTYRIQNIDFGIVERARQSLDLNKRVKTLKLDVGYTIVDVTIDEDGKMTGQTKYVTYMGPSPLTMPNNGFVKLELDSELIHGAKLMVGYEIKATNNSELDYLSEKFYKYGIKEGNLVTITPSAIIDYLDKDWGFNPEENTAWEIKTLDEIKDIVAETVYNNENSSIAEKTILYTEVLKEEKLEPTKSATVMLNVSTELDNSNEISLDNETEVAKVEKTGGSKLDSTPGNYVPGTGKTESDDDMAETVIVTPSTGANLNFILPVMLGVSLLVILAAGVVLIKKKIL